MKRKAPLPRVYQERSEWLLVPRMQPQVTACDGKLPRTRRGCRQKGLPGAASLPPLWLRGSELGYWDLQIARASALDLAGADAAGIFRGHSAEVQTQPDR